MTLINVDSAIQVSCRLATIVIRDVAVTGSTEQSELLLRQTAERLRERYGNVTPGEIERVKAVREMYRNLHMDPHHTRPSSEALLRRVLRGEGLPRVNEVVDPANCWSVSTLCPVGLYDLDRIHGEVSFRFGGSGDGYEGIRKEWVSVSERPVLSDDLGPFGNPTSDSRRTAVVPGTANLLVVAFQPLTFPRSEVEELETAVKSAQRTSA